MIKIMMLTYCPGTYDEYALFRGVDAFTSEAALRLIEENPDERITRENFKNAFCYECKEFPATDEQRGEIYSSQFRDGESHGWFTDVMMIEGNKIGYDPDKHSFLCHKCCGQLIGNAKLRGCECISGWVRSNYSYCTHEQAEVAQKKNEDRRQKVYEERQNK
jgi:hypothetical protein